MIEPVAKGEKVEDAEEIDAIERFVQIALKVISPMVLQQTGQLTTFPCDCIDAF